MLSDFVKSEQEMLDDLLRGLSDGAVELAAGNGPKFLNAVALRVSPPRPSTGTQGKPAPASDAPNAAPVQKRAAESPRSPFEKLKDHFRK